jgi:hypothetical protein
MKCLRYWIAISLIAAGTAFCQAQAPAATLACESPTSMVTFNLVDYNLPNTPPPSVIPSTGGALGQNGFIQGFVDAAVNPNLAAILGNSSSAQLPFVNCWLAPSASPAAWEVILSSVVITGVQFSSAPAAQGSSATPQPFVRIAMEYSAMSINCPAGNGPALPPTPAPVPLSGGGISSPGSPVPIGATPAPSSGSVTTTSTSN